MEKIVLEVDDEVAKAWNEAPGKKRKDIELEINNTIARELIIHDNEDIIVFLRKLRNEMAERGLTQEILDDILKDES